MRWWKMRFAGTARPAMASASEISTIPGSMERAPAIAGETRGIPAMRLVSNTTSSSEYDAVELSARSTSKRS